MTHSLEYLAGFMDGEGWICYSGGQWEVNCTQTEKNDISPLRSMQERWGGSLCCATPDNARHYITWRWKARGIDAAIALYDMAPFLTIKLEKATKALESMRKKPRIRLILSRLSEPRHVFEPGR